MDFALILDHRRQNWSLMDEHVVMAAQCTHVEAQRCLVNTVDYSVGRDGLFTPARLAKVANRSVF